MKIYVVDHGSAEDRLEVGYREVHAMLGDTLRHIRNGKWNRMDSAYSVSKMDVTKGVSLHDALSLAIYHHLGEAESVEYALWQQLLYDALDEAALNYYDAKHYNGIINALVESGLEDDIYQYLQVFNAFLAYDKNSVVSLIKRAMRNVEDWHDIPSGKLLAARKEA